MSVIRTLASTDNPLFAQRSMAAAAIGAEKPLHAEPPHDTTAHLLGERGQIRLGDRPNRQKHRRPVTDRHEDAVGRARMQMHVVIERRSEAVRSRKPAGSRTLVKVVRRIRLWAGT